MTRCACIGSVDSFPLLYRLTFLTRILIYGVTVRQRSEDLDVAHVEELKILADEHEQQLELLRSQLTEQIDKMSAEAEAIQAEHEADIQKDKVS